MASLRKERYCDSYILGCSLSSFFVKGLILVEHSSELEPWHLCYRKERRAFNLVLLKLNYVRLNRRALA